MKLKSIVFLFFGISLLSACSSSGSGGASDNAQTGIIADPNASAQIVVTGSSSSESSSTSSTSTATIGHERNTRNISSTSGTTSFGESVDGIYQSGTVVLNGKTYKFTDKNNPRASENNELQYLIEHVTFNDEGDDKKYADLHGYTLSDSNSTYEMGHVIIGDLTPVADLPAKANYEGSWSHLKVKHPNSSNSKSSINGTDGASLFISTGTFKGTADFGSAQNVTGTLNNNSAINYGVLKADINGNKFSGNVNFTDSSEKDLAVTGGFYGPNAEKIAGSGGLRENNDTYSIGFIGITDAAREQIESTNAGSVAIASGGNSSSSGNISISNSSSSNKSYISAAD